MKRLLWLLIILPTPLFGAFVLVEDFNNLGLGPMSGQNGWTAGDLWSVEAAPSGGNGNSGAGFFSTTASQSAYKFLDLPIVNASTAATLFFRLRREGVVNSSSGLSDDPAAPLFASFEAQMNSQAVTPDSFNVRDAGAFDPLGSGSFADATWYNIWMVVNNAANTYQVWKDAGDFGSPNAAQTHIADPNGAAGDFDFGFRNGAAANPLTGILLAIGSDVNSNGIFYVDDFYVDLAGENLSNPVPEPSTVGLLAVAGALALARRKRAD